MRSQSGVLIQLCQHSSDITDLFLPRNSKSFSDISVTELICVLTLNEFKKAKPNKFLSLNMGGSMHF